MVLSIGYVRKISFCISGKESDNAAKKFARLKKIKVAIKLIIAVAYVIKQSTPAISKISKMIIY